MAFNHQAGQIINKEVDLLTVLALHHQAGQITDRKVDLLTVLALHHQAGQTTDREVDLLTVLALHHQAGQITNKEVDLLTVLAFNHQAEQITHLEVDLLTVLASDRQAEQVTDLEVALLVDIRVLEAENTRDLLEVPCGENHQDQVTEALHSNNNLNTVCDVGINMLVETALTMHSIEDLRVMIVTYNTRLRVTRNEGVILITGPSNRQVA